MFLHKEKNLQNVHKSRTLPIYIQVKYSINLILLSIM